MYYKDVFARDKFDIGRVKDVKVEIRLKREEYIAKRPYRTTIEDKKEIETQVEKMLKHIIKMSDSSYSSPVTLAYKKEDGRRTRFCVDFRELNKLVVPESYSFPRIEDLIDRTHGCRYFTSLDINSVFWSIPTRKNDREKFAFSTQEGHYQFNWSNLIGLRCRVCVTPHRLDSKTRIFI